MTLHENIRAPVGGVVGLIIADRLSSDTNIHVLLVGAAGGFYVGGML